MTDRTLIGRDYVSILPGNYHATAKSECLSTLLGSCVAACLYDPVNQVVGMNHFLLCGTSNPQNIPLLMTDSGRYGVHAMELLINAMLNLGAQRRNLRAKVFGGANMFETTAASSRSVGEMNALFIRNFLRKENIPLLAHDLGGTHGRVIYFMPEDYSVLVRRIRKMSQREVARREARLLEKTRRKLEKGFGREELWD